MEKNINEISKEVEFEVQKVSKEFKKDWDKYIDETETESILQIILRSHLYIEQEITNMLKTKLLKPSHILGISSFYQKLNLAISLGLIPEDKKEVLLEVNKIRNKYAHDLSFELTDHHYKKLKKLIVGSTADLISNENNDSVESESLSKKIRNVLAAIWIHLRIESETLPHELRLDELNIKAGKKIMEIIELIQTKKSESTS